MTNFEKWKQNIVPEDIALWMEDITETWMCKQCPAYGECECDQCPEDFVKWANEEAKDENFSWHTPEQIEEQKRYCSKRDEQREDDDDGLVLYEADMTEEEVKKADEVLNHLRLSKDDLL